MCKLQKELSPVTLTVPTCDSCRVMTCNLVLDPSMCTLFVAWGWVLPNPANWCSRSATVCFTRARDIVFDHKIKFCVNVVRMVWFPCVWLCFICVSFEFTLGSCEFTLLSSTWWIQNGFKLARRENKKSWTHASPNMLERCVNYRSLPSTAVTGRSREAGLSGAEQSAALSHLTAFFWLALYVCWFVIFCRNLYVIFLRKFANVFD